MCFARSWETPVKIPEGSRNFSLSKMSRQALGFLQDPIKLVQGFFPRVKASGPWSLQLAPWLRTNGSILVFPQPIWNFIVLFYFNLLWLFYGQSPVLSYVMCTSGPIIQISASKDTSTKQCFFQVALSDGRELCKITLNVFIEKNRRQITRMYVITPPFVMNRHFTMNTCGIILYIA